MPCTEFDSNRTASLREREVDVFYAKIGGCQNKPHLPEVNRHAKHKLSLNMLQKPSHYLSALGPVVSDKKISK